jgi:ribosomal protein S18 acetylase RimI-like enzyme
MSGDSTLSQEPELLVERLKHFTDNDLNTLCEATDAAIIDGGGFGWVTPPGRRALETYFRGLLLVPERELFVARLNGDIVGSAILARPPKNNEAQAFAANLMHSYIAPYARGHGLARRLTEAVEERARELGYHIMNLDVRETQTVAIRMYESQGYIRWGEHPEYALVRGKSSAGYFFYKRLRPPKSTGGI